MKRWLFILVIALVTYFIVFPVALPTLSKLTKPPIRQKANGYYTFEQEWSISVDGQAYQIPANYTSNGITADIKVKEWLGGNSIDSDSTRAAMIHDWFIVHTLIDRNLADRIFYAALKQGDTPWLKAKLMYHAVTIRTLRNRIKGVRYRGKNSPAWGAK